MAELKIEISEELEKTIHEFKLDWEEVARRAISKKAQQLAFMKYFASESELTEEDALILGNKVNEAVSEKYKKLI